MNLQTTILLALFTPLAAADGAACGSSGGATATEAPLSAVVNDVNGNGVEDGYDIATGSLSDEDLDGIPDEAQARDEDEEGSPRG